MSKSLGYPQGAVCDLVYSERMRSILLIKKLAHKFDGDNWGCPGGKQEHGETIEDAAWRELREECGVGMNKATLRYHGVIAVVEDIIPEIEKHYLCTVNLFLERPGIECNPVNAEPEHHAAVRWFRDSRLPANTTKAFKIVMDAITHCHTVRAQPAFMSLCNWEFGGEAA